MSLFLFSNDKCKSAGKERRAVQLLSALWDEMSLLSTGNEESETEIFINISKIARKATDFRPLDRLFFLCIVYLL